MPQWLLTQPTPAAGVLEGRTFRVFSSTWNSGGGVWGNASSSDTHERMNEMARGLTTQHHPLTVPDLLLHVTGSCRAFLYT